MSTQTLASTALQTLLTKVPEASRQSMCQPPKAEFKNFATFSDPLLLAMRQAAERYVARMFEMCAGLGPWPWLVFLGSSGIGKTMLSQSVFDFWNAYIRPLEPRPGENFSGNHLRYGRFVEMRNFMRRLRNGERNISESIEDVIADGFVVLDDVGSGMEADGKRKAFDVDVLDQIVAGRCGKPTVFNCNFLFEQIAEVMDARIASRLLRHNSAEFCVSGTTADFNLRGRH